MVRSGERITHCPCEARRYDIVGSGPSGLEPTYGVALFEAVVEDRLAGEEDDDATTSHV